MRLELSHDSDCQQLPQHSASMTERAANDQDPRKRCGKVLTNTVLSLQQRQTQTTKILHNKCEASQKGSMLAWTSGMCFLKQSFDCSPYPAYHGSLHSVL